MLLIRLAAVCLAGFGLYKYATRPRTAPAAFAIDEGSHGNRVQVRNAGADAMRDKPQRWTEVDEVSDSSFPASDPPSTY